MVQELIKHVVTSLVANPHDVVVVLRESDMRQILEISVKRQDIPKILGKEGRTFKAIRSLVAAISSLQEADVVLESE